MPSKEGSDEWELPSLREIHQIPLGSDLWDIKFYPYNEHGVDPVFAMVGKTHILICRPPSEEHGNNTVQYEKFVFEKDAGDDGNFSCAWTKDLDTNTPLLCVAGENAKILIIDALTGRLVRTLIGHGGYIADLVVSPANPYILASASEDRTVRIWSLDPAHKRQPCAAILAGDGHRERALNLAFHKSGRYLLCGEFGHRINLWTLPIFPDINTGTDIPTRIYYPHFSSTEICLDAVDCVEFFGDLILSKASNENMIVLWAIHGFSSNLTPPPPSTAPTSHDIKRPTLSAFKPKTHTTRDGTTSSFYYTRILQLHTPTSEVLWARFSLYPGSDTSHPVLALCNNVGKIFFWDFKRFEEYYDWEDTEPPELDLDETGNPRQINSLSSLSLKDDESIKRPSFLAPVTRRPRGAKGYNPRGRGPFQRVRDNSPTESASSAQTGTDSQSGNANGFGMLETNEKVDWRKTKKSWEFKYSLGEMMENKEAHKVVDVSRSFALCGRQVAWSGDGVWCVAVGNDGVFVLLQRWAK